MYEKEWRLFEAFLRERGQKVTSRRREVREAIFATHQHVTVEELMARLKEKGRQASRATVYRTLELMEQADLVKKMDIGDGVAVYEHTYGHAHHDHLICLSCRRIIECENETIEREQEHVCRRAHFTPTMHVHQIFGYCKQCRKKGRRR